MPSCWLHVDLSTALVPSCASQFSSLRRYVFNDQRKGNLTKEIRKVIANPTWFQPVTQYVMNSNLAFDTEAEWSAGCDYFHFHNLLTQHVNQQTWWSQVKLKEMQETVTILTADNGSTHHFRMLVAASN